MMRRYILIAVGFLLLAGAGAAGAGWFAFRIYVPQDQCAVLIRKTGQTLPDGQTIATEPGQKGIQEEVLGPGRHFRNPYTWDHKFKPLVEVPAGDPSTWEWFSSLNSAQRDALRAGTFRFKGEFPQIGVVTRRIGPEPEAGGVLVTRESGDKGILREVLTPGTYRINPYIYDVELHPAVVIPAGFVGVVTNLFGDGSDGALDTSDALPAEGEPVRKVRALANPGERGTLRDVLQPGVYFINPKLQKVTLIEIGFNEYSQIKVSETENMRIAFPSATGYLIRVGVTVIWGIDPKYAAETINEYGTSDRVIDKVIGPQLRSICRNVGSTYDARDFIQGEKREQFQRAMTAELQRVCREKNIEVLLALVREIEVHAPGSEAGGSEVTDDLKRTIQESFVAIEKQVTKGKQTDAAVVQAQLEEEKKKVDIARETVLADTRVMVAQTIAEGEKRAAEIDAQAGLDVATVEQEIAGFDAQRIEVLGKAEADVVEMEKGAEAKGYELLVQALGGGQAYNLYTFAQNFQPESIRLFFAGDGTFWTDLSRFEEVGAAKILESASKEEAVPARRLPN